MARRRYSRRSKKSTRRTTKRTMRKQAIAPRLGGKITQPVHYFKRHIDFGAIQSTSNQAFTTGAIYIEPSTDIPGWSEFSALYDSYKINALKVMFIPVSDQIYTFSSSGTPTTYHSQYDFRFLSCIDYNDRSAPATLNVIREYDNCKLTPNNRIHKRYFKPSFTLDVENTAQSAIMPNKYKPWLSTSAGDVEFYALKYGFEHQTNTASVPAYRIEIKVYMSFKAKR